MLRKRIIWVFILTLVLIPTQLVLRVSAATATVGINPPTSTVAIGDTFTLNITVSNINNFTSWQLELYYLNSVLNCTAANEGPFLQGAPKGTYFSRTITNNYNSSYGQLSAYDTVQGLNYSVNGTGVIATVTFKAVGGGSTNLSFSGILLGDEKIPPHAIAYTATGGTVTVTGATQDIAVTNVVSPKIVIFQGYAGNINVSFSNNGNSIVTFNSTCFANTTQAIQNQTIYNLPVGTSPPVIFVWNTTGFAKGNYSISAYAWPVPGETVTTNNNLTDGWIVVSMVGDLTGGTRNPWDFVPDGKVDGKDIAIVALCFGSAPGSIPPYTWNSNCDVNNDGKVDGKDIAIVALHFGQADP